MLNPDDLEPRRVGRLWIFPDGTTLPVVSGGDGSDDDAGDDDDDDLGDEGDDDTGDGDDEGDKPLGPKGEKALAAEKDRRRRLAAKLREWNALGLSAAEVKAKLEAEGGKPPADGDKPDLERLKAEARAEVQAEAMRDRVLDKIEAKASRLFADPDDAPALLMRGRTVDDFLDDEGKVDVEAIVDALDELIKAKPYLAAKPAADDGDEVDDEGKPAKGKPAPKVPTGPRGGKPKALADHSVDDFRELLKKR